jgi:hypothetical protein
MSTTPRHPSALPAATPAGLTDPTTPPITDPRGSAADVGAGDVGAGDVPVPLARLAGALLAGLATGLLICAALVMTLEHPHHPERHHRGGADNARAALTLAAFTTHTGAPAPVAVRELNTAAPTHRPALPVSVPVSAPVDSGDCSDWQRLTPAVGPDDSDGSDGSGDGPGRRPGLLVHAPGVDVSVGVNVSAHHCDHSRDDSRGDSWDGSLADPSADHHNGRDDSGRDDGRDDDGRVDDRRWCGCGDRQGRPWNGHGPADRSSWTPYGYTNPNPNGPGYPAGSGYGTGTGYGAQTGYPGGGYSNGYPSGIPAGCRVIADANDPRGLIVCPSAPGW